MQTDRGTNKRKEQKSDLVAGTTPKHEAWQDKLVWYKGRQGLFRKEGRGTLVRTIGRRKDKEIRVTLISYFSKDKTNAIQTMCVTQWQCLTMVRTWGTTTSFSLSGNKGVWYLFAQWKGESTVADEGKVHSSQVNIWVDSRWSGFERQDTVSQRAKRM